MLASKTKAILLLSLSSALYVMLSVFVVEQMLHSERMKHEIAVTNTVNLQLLGAKNVLESAVILDTYVGSSIATLATVSPDVVKKNWSTIGRQLVETAKFARSVALAPNDVIGFVYPVTGNEKAIGLDLRSIPTQYRVVQQAREQQQVMIAGPFNLVQGGQGIVIRYPVFADFPANQQYWGNVSVVIDFEQLVKISGLNDIEGASLALRGRDASGADGEVFFGEADVFTAADISFSIDLPSGSWLLAAKYNPAVLNYSNTMQTVVRATSYTVAIICYLALGLLVLGYRRSRQHAHTDALTGLVNRRFMLQKLDELQQQPAHKPRFALLNIDLNGFKAINDQYGHDAGDAVLCFVAQQLKQLMRSSDVVARMGGDEFLLMLHRIDNLDTAQAQADKIRAHFASHKLQWQDIYFQAALSIGVAHCQEKPGDIKALLALADKRMYEQKRGNMEYVI